MIIQKIILENFRQFKGQQSIQFASRSNGGDCNVTVVFGENGRGKTGIYRAILFALFGDTRLNQDGDLLSSEIRLVNVDCVYEADERQPVEATVELAFEHNDIHYTVIRKRVAARRGKQITEDPGSVLLRMLLPDGNTEVIQDSETLQSKIDTVIDPRVKDYYLFDGERMDRLTRAGATQRREVAKGIRNLLNIDALENARSAMERVTEKFSADLTKASSVAYAKALMEIEVCQKEIVNLKSRIEEIDAEVELGDDEIRKIDKEMEAFADIKELVQRRQELNRLHTQRVRDRLTTRLTLSNLVTRSAVLLVRPVVTKAHSAIEAVRKRGDLPAEIRRDLIDRLIKIDECVCGRPLASDPAALKTILAWLDKTTEEAIEDAALRLWQHVGGIITHTDDYETEISSHMQLYGNASNDIAEYERQLEEITSTIGSSERNDAGELEAHRSRADKKRISLMADRKLADTQLHDNKLKLDLLKATAKEEEEKQAKKDEFTLRVELARKVTDALDEVSTQFISEIKDRLAALATHALEELLDYAGKTNICRVRVADDYTLEVYNRVGDPWLAEISAGQRQVLSIAFVAALAEAASDGHLLEMPLFMDTPFGRLSSIHRDNLIKLVPNKSAQWVLLATDTEFRGEEAHMLTTTNRWGKLYFLEQDVLGNTTIVERDANANAFLTYMRDRGIV